MSPANLVIAIIAIIAAVIAVMVLMKAFYNRRGGQTGSTSNNLMQLRLFVQVLAVGLIMFVLWLSGGGRPT